jgi:hypothetical protein
VYVTYTLQSNIPPQTSPWDATGASSFTLPSAYGDNVEIRGAQKISYVQASTTSNAAYDSTELTSNNITMTARETLSIRINMHKHNTTVDKYMIAKDCSDQSTWFPSYLRWPLFSEENATYAAWENTDKLTRGRIYDVCLRVYHDAPTSQNKWIVIDT